MDYELYKSIAQGSPTWVILIIGFIWINGKLKDICKVLEKLETGKTWKGECDLKHIEVERRLDELERKTA